MLGRQNRLTGWQFAQYIDAIQILYCKLLATPDCQRLDWDYWHDSARQLDIDHPTTARQLTPDELSYLKERKGEGPLKEVRAAHLDLLPALRVNELLDALHIPSSLLLGYGCFIKADRVVTEKA